MKAYKNSHLEDAELLACHGSNQQINLSFNSIVVAMIFQVSTGNKGVGGLRKITRKVNGLNRIWILKIKERFM
ncbi:MAG: hypothetical protein QW520_08090 [Methanomassiliicoccales archaeon]